MTSKLKDALCEESDHVHSDMFEKPYYFKSYKDNIFDENMSEDHFKMFKSGSGKELNTKAKAVYSSSMLAYNFFHWISTKQHFNYDGIDYDKVVFEVKIPTIINSPAPANLDVVLVSQDKSTWLMLESKFMEYSHRSSSEMRNPSHGYMVAERFFFKGPSDEAENIIELVKYWSGEAKAKNEKGERRYYDGIKQLLCHLIAIKNLADYAARDKIATKFKKNNEFLKEDLDKLKTIKFRTLLFDPLPRFEERNVYEDYKTLCDEFRDSLKKHSLIFDFDTIAYSEIWKAMGGDKLDTELKEYLKDRYMQFSAIEQK